MSKQRKFFKLLAEEINNGELLKYSLSYKVLIHFNVRRIVDIYKIHTFPYLVELEVFTLESLKCHLNEAISVLPAIQMKESLLQHNDEDIYYLWK